MGKKPTGFARQKIKVLHEPWLPFDEWISKINYNDRLYWEGRTADIHRYYEQQVQAERHKAFEENAKKHNIPIPTRKKKPWED